MNNSKQSSKGEARKELARRELARRKLLPFICFNFPDYKTNWHHELIAEKLERVERGELKRLIVVMPPRHGKSELCSVQFPAWAIGRNKDKNIIEASYSADLATDFGRQVRNIIAGEKYHHLFPSVELAEDSQAKGKWNTNGRGAYNAVGVGGATTGKGADILIIDDPVKNRQDAESEVVRESTWNWYTSVARTRLSPQGAIIIPLTRWHDDDLVGRILRSENASEWEVLHLPAIATEDEQYRKRGDALWADHFSLDILESTKRDIGSYDWSALYQGNPLDSESQEFRKDFFQYRSEADLNEKRLNRYLTIDLAFSDKETADNIGFCDNRVDGTNRWNLRAWGRKLSPKDFIDYLFVLHRENNYLQMGILDKHSQYTIVIKPFIEEECRKRNIFLPISTIKTQETSKELRIRALIPRYLNQAVYHLEGACVDLETELLRFPKGVHDDVADATAAMVGFAQPPNHAELDYLYRRTTRNRPKNNAI
ncbi:terminase large subunit domain-containing protein [Bradyrhizobium sp. AUGA SZCCT0431]|uniref:terminase large subunit domain-containing protein n=1 Tax=Bradyrhizobium sp. AUGA SZCCT0431 TaxID=2807674 RepID=UPI001BA5378C|nr:terminase family protein [Bradyrhizobium sp. AUGA SZCCT0431]MBR1146686.1 terminase family protein [Bradyrhizobium sp. AUGA SZCCT0431]